MTSEMPAVDGRKAAERAGRTVRRALARGVTRRRRQETPGSVAAELKPWGAAHMQTRAPRLRTYCDADDAASIPTVAPLPTRRAPSDALQSDASARGDQRAGTATGKAN